MQMASYFGQIICKCDAVIEKLEHWRAIAY